MLANANQHLAGAKQNIPKIKIASFLWLLPAWPLAHILRTPPLPWRPLCSLHAIVMLNVTSSFFQSFFEGQSAPWDSAKKDENRMKNRYGNIIACKRCCCAPDGIGHQAHAVRIYCAITAFISAARAGVRARAKRRKNRPWPLLHQCKPRWGPGFTFRFKV